MVLLYRELEWSCFAGLVVMIALMPINTKVARTQQTFTRNTMKARDKRVNLLSEMLQAIRCPQLLLLLSASLVLMLLSPLVLLLLFIAAFANLAHLFRAHLCAAASVLAFCVTSSGWLGSILSLSCCRLWLVAYCVLSCSV